MESLTELNLSNCPYISDYSVLTQFPNLKKLNISFNKTKDFSFLKNLSSLEELAMEQTGFSDMTLLNQMSNLRKLDVSKNELSNVHKFKNASNLVEFRARFCQLTDI